MLLRAEEGKEEWVRPEIESAPEQRTLPFDSHLLPPASGQPEYIWRVIRFYFKKVSLLTDIFISGQLVVLLINTLPSCHKQMMKKHPERI